ncbi:MAG: two-component sensor histidine kinase [Betaproteobacteria bacterium HGW-Betaproteobacteria-3]|nr:MAG: two-component sensor histidine kinase [Betaproteobacteria bacterium HGW-Betaproteobacteria-3]
MALLPLLVVLPLMMLVLLLWSNAAYDRLLIAKVRADLAVAHGYFEQVVSEVGSGTESVAASHALLQALGTTSTATGAAGAPTTRPRTATLLTEARERLGLDFLQVYAPGEVPLVYSGGRVVARLAVLPNAEFLPLAPHLGERLRIPLVPTRNAAPTDRALEDRAMVIVATAPVLDDHGQVIAVLRGGVLLNQNLPFIDHINRIVYPNGSLPFGSQGTATLFMDDVRITTNVRLFQDQRAIGTRISRQVGDAVLGRGETFLDSAFVVNDWYVSAYEPLRNDVGERIGVLYVGYLEEPFRWIKYGMLGLVGAIFLLVMALSAVFSVRWARSIFRPVEQMNRTMQRVEDGDAGARVGTVGAQDELGALATHLDQLLDVIDDKTRALQRWAGELDQKVAERTAELAASNASLQQAQNQLVKSEKLAAIGQLTASVAHEINNPIAVIQGNLDLMRETLGDHAQPVAAELRLMDEQVNRMRLIVTQLLQYARPTEYAGYVDAVDVNRTLQDCLVLVSHLLEHTGIAVAQDLQASLRVGINRQELQQVVINLMVNAIQVMPDGGTLTLRTRDWADPDGGRGVCIHVLDTGTGLPDPVREKLFRPFFTTKNDGNGLGLWISQGLVERYGGSIDAANQTGLPPGATGAVFTIRLWTEPRVPDASGATTNNGRPLPI